MLILQSPDKTINTAPTNPAEWLPHWHNGNLSLFLTGYCLRHGISPTLISRPDNKSWKALDFNGFFAHISNGGKQLRLLWVPLRRGGVSGRAYRIVYLRHRFISLRRHYQFPSPSDTSAKWQNNGRRGGSQRVNIHKRDKGATGTFSCFIAPNRI